MKKVLFIFLFCSLVIPSIAQSWVSIQVLSESSKQGIKDVHVLNLTDNVAAITNHQGLVHFKTASNRKIKISVSHVSYQPMNTWVWLNSNDSSKLTIELKEKIYELKAFDALESKKPEQMFHSKFDYVHDFEVLGNRLILITYSLSLKKDPRLTICDMNQNVLNEIPILKQPKSLFIDFAGRIFIEYPNKVQLVHAEGKELSLRNIDPLSYANSVKPCKDSLNNLILFSDQIWYLPRFNYFAYDAQDSMVFLLKHIVFDDILSMMQWEYYTMDVLLRQEAQKIAKHFPEMDETEVGGLMCGFQNSFYYQQPYAPLFVRKDTIHIFDHYTDHLYRFNKQLETLDSIQISYHKPQKKRSWKRKVYLDSESDRFYGLFLKNGYSYLKHIDIQSGGVLSSVKLQNQFVKKIRIHDDYAYYIYKPANSAVKPFIYRELLSAVNE